MAATPESKVKKKVHAMLKEHGAYAVNYIGGQYANSGTPDILACLSGFFIGIECKAGRGRPTALQIKNLRDIAKAGGLALVINEDNLAYLEESLNDIKHAQSNYHIFAVEAQDE
jgi:Holliday junction resolvase